MPTIQQRSVTNAERQGEDQIACSAFLPRAPRRVHTRVHLHAEEPNSGLREWPVYASPQASR